MITTARILVGKPTIIQQKHIHTQFYCIIHQLHQFRFIKIKIGGFPVIQQSHTSLVPILHLILTGPIMEITASLSFTCKTVSKIKIGSTEDFIRFQTIFRSIRINTRNNTQFVLIIYFEYKTEITCPS